MQSDAGIGLDKSTGTVTFRDGDRQALTQVAITGTGFLKLNTTFSVYVTNVLFLETGGKRFLCV